MVLSQFYHIYRNANSVRVENVNSSTFNFFPELFIIFFHSLRADILRYVYKFVHWHLIRFLFTTYFSIYVLIGNVQLYFVELSVTLQLTINVMQTHLSRLDIYCFRTAILVYAHTHSLTQRAQRSTHAMCVHKSSKYLHSVDIVSSSGCRNFCELPLIRCV